MTAYEQQVRAQLQAFAESEDKEAAAAARATLDKFDVQAVGQALREGVPVALCVAGLMGAE